MWSLSSDKNVLKKFVLDSNDKILDTHLIPITSDFLSISYKMSYEFLNKTINSLIETFNIKPPHDNILIHTLLNGIL